MHASVYNMGVGGYGPVQYYALTEGKSLYPKTWDGHPIPAGYQVFAQAVYDEIQKP